jgi:hypothetical protein
LREPCKHHFRRHHPVCVAVDEGVSRFEAEVVVEVKVEVLLPAAAVAAAAAAATSLSQALKHQ